MFLASILTNISHAHLNFSYIQHKPTSSNQSNNTEMKFHSTIEIDELFTERDSCVKWQHGKEKPKIPYPRLSQKIDTERGADVWGEREGRSGREGCLD